MKVEAEVEELVSRCVAIVVCCYHFARTWKDWASILAKIQALSEDFDSSEVAFHSIRPLILLELSERFDQETADRLGLEFTDLFLFIFSSDPVVVGQA